MTRPDFSINERAWYDRKRIVQLIAFVASIVGAAFALFGTAYVRTTQSSDSSGEVFTQTQTQTLLEVNGLSVIAFFLVPVILTGILLIVGGRARMPISIGVTVLLVGFVIISGATIGVFFYMAAICAVVSLFVPAPSRTG